MFNVGDKVYNVRDVDYLMPYIQEFLVAEPMPKARKTSLVTLAPVSHPDSISLRKFKTKGELAHTIAGAHTMLDKAIDARIQKLRDKIEELALYKEAQLKEA